MTQVIIAAVIFTALVLLLSAAVLIARRALEPRGSVQVRLSNGRTLELAAGQHLLSALAEQGIYLPAACGGRGSCGQCRVKILGHAPPLQPTEANHIGLRDAQRGARLACALVLRADIELELPPAVLGADRWRCTVRTSRHLSAFLKEVVLALPAGERVKFQAGQYVLLETPAHDLKFTDFDIDPEYRAEWQRFGLLDLWSQTREPIVRAYSLANPPSEDKALTLVVRIATPPAGAPPGTPPGQGSSYIFSLKPGDSATARGPFGSFEIKPTQREMIFIGGGVGIAPLRAMILDQLLRVRTKRRMSFWYGARNTRELCYHREFEALAREHENFSLHLALSAPRADDQWCGDTGFIHKVLLERYLKSHPTPEEAEYYLCGPPLMSAAVIQMLEDIGVERDSIFFDDFQS
jgi:Na+-transporting NADH:ubiquinone oxidoreductase subunit F